MGLGGSTSYAHATSQAHENFDPKSKTRIFIRYYKGSKCYVLLDDWVDDSI